jgi:hypothetical protein
MTHIFKRIKVMLIMAFTVVFLVLMGCSQKNNNRQEDNERENTPRPTVNNKTSAPSKTEPPRGNPAPVGVEAEPVEMFEYEFDHNNNGIRLTSYLGSKLRVKIPDTIEGLPVVGIDTYCFAVGDVIEVFFPETLVYFEWGGNISSKLEGVIEYRIPHGVTHLLAPKRILDGDMDKEPSNKHIQSLENVIIPNTVVEIGDSAFRYLYTIKRIDIPDSVRVIGQYAFATGVWGDSSQLEEVTIPYGVVEIGDNAFYGTALTNVTIPDSVTSIGMDAFARSDLTSVVLGNSLEKLSGFANTKLTGIVIPNSVTSIGYGAFSNCTGLTDIVIPDSVLNIGDAAFSNCTGLTDIVIPDSVLNIGDAVFRGCTGLTNVTIGNSVTDIGRRAFFNCTGLTSIVIPDSVTSIGKEAFGDCTGLMHIIIGNTVTRISYDAFWGCTSLSEDTIQRISGINPDAWF